MLQVILYCIQDISRHVVRHFGVLWFFFFFFIVFPSSVVVGPAFGADQAGMFPATSLSHWLPLLEERLTSDGCPVRAHLTKLPQASWAYHLDRQEVMVDRLARWPLLLAFCGLTGSKVRSTHSLPLFPLAPFLPSILSCWHRSCCRVRGQSQGQEENPKDSPGCAQQVPIGLLHSGPRSLLWLLI